MSKEDTPLPAEVPRKRRQLEGALDLHLAQWLAGDTLTPSERRRLEEEKARRKTAIPTRLVVRLVPKEGMTPEQKRAVYVAVGEEQATTIATIVHVPDGATRDKLRTLNPDAIVAAVKETREPAGVKTGVWDAVKFARHRRLAVRVVLPDGSTMEETR